jgi:hypothetical protein
MSETFNTTCKEKVDEQFEPKCFNIALRQIRFDVTISVEKAFLLNYIK